jgi:hypothetical protein
VDYIVTAVYRGERLTSKGVIFMAPATFVGALEVFERTRTGSAILEGSDHCRLVLEADGRMGHAWLTFHVARTLYAFSPQTGRSRSGEITLRGSFAVSGEFIRQIAHDFAELFREERRTNERE